MARLATANDIINRAAVESGLLKDSNPVASTDESFVQLTELLNGAGQEMVELNNWQALVKTHQIITQEGDSGTYDLPDDFSYMIDQSGWEHTNTAPLGGPLSSQDWTYLEGRDLVSDTIYVSFRLVDNKFDIYPQNPVLPGLDINFEYMSRDWVREAGGTSRDTIGNGSDLILFEPILMIKYLKVKFLMMKGFDVSGPLVEFENMFNSRTGKDRSAPILSAGQNARGFPYLTPYRNTSDTGYGF